MNILERLETEIESLLVRNRELRTAEAHARDKAVASEQECSVLKEENRTIRLALEREKALREEAVTRIDAIIRRVQEKKGEEQVFDEF